MKQCKRCEVFKDESMFWKQTKSADGLRPFCKDCDKAVKRENEFKRKLSEAIANVEEGLIKGFEVIGNRVTEIQFDHFAILDDADLEELPTHFEIALTNYEVLTKEEALKLIAVDRELARKVLYLADVYY